MSWLSWIIQLFKKHRSEQDNRTLIKYSPNRRAQLWYEVQNHPGAVCTFYLVNPTDSTGDIVLQFDNIPLLYQEFKRQKISRSIGVRDSNLERQLVESQEQGCNYRMTVILAWTVQGRNKEKRLMRELKYVWDFKWGIQNQYDTPYKSFKAFAFSMLREELPEHRSDWGKYLCDPYAIDWASRLAITAEAQDIRVIFQQS